MRQLGLPVSILRILRINFINSKYANQFFPISLFVVDLLNCFCWSISWIET